VFNLTIYRRVFNKAIKKDFQIQTTLEPMHPYSVTAGEKDNVNAII